MTDKQPEALRLANDLEIDYGGDVVAHEAAAELRFLHKKCEALTADTIEEMRRITKIYRLEAQRDELLEVLRDLVQLEADGRTEYESSILHWDAARAVIAKVEGKT